MHLLIYNHCINYVFFPTRKQNVLSSKKYSRHRNLWCISQGKRYICFSDIISNSETFCFYFLAHILCNYYTLSAGNRKKEIKQSLERKKNTLRSLSALSLVLYISRTSLSPSHKGLIYFCHSNIRLFQQMSWEFIKIHRSTSGLSR